MKRYSINKAINTYPRRARSGFARVGVFVLLLAAVAAMSFISVEQRASAQAQTCSISQVTDSGGESVSGRPAISRSGGRIAFSSNRDFTGGNPDGNYEIFVSVGANFTQVTNTTGGASSQPSIDFGVRVAFISNRDLTGGNADGNDEVFFFDFGTGAFTQVTDTVLAAGLGHQRGPVISGSGGFIAFASDGDLTGSNPDRSWEYFRYEIASGTTAQITNSTGPNFNFAPSISDNGTRIAFLATIDPNGTNPDRNGEIFVWDSISNSLTQITDTTGATFEPPSIDPAGRFVASSGNYNPLGTNRDGNFEIFVWDASIGTTRQVTNSVYGSFSPQISGQGTYVVFQSNGDLTGGNADLNNEIFLYAAATNAITQITSTTSTSVSQMASIDETGALIAFVSDADIAAGGNPDGNVEIFLAACSPPPTPPSDRILFQTNRDGNNEVYAMNADGSNPTNLTSFAAADDGNPAWSFDGTKIAFETDRDGNYEIYVMNADGSNQVNLSNNTNPDFEPAWSPDGTKIAFMSLRDGDEEIFVMDADGNNQIQLTSNSSLDSTPAWSPDGTRIAFTSNRSGVSADIWVMNADGSNPTQLTNSLQPESDPAWSPDSSQIAFWRSVGSGSTSEIYIMDPDGSNETFVTGGAVLGSPVWSPDGNKLALSRLEGPNDFEIFAVDLNSTNLTNLTNAAGINDLLPDWRISSPSTTPTPTPTPTTTPTPVPTPSPTPQPTPVNGVEKIVFHSQRDDGTTREIYIMNSDGTGQRRLTYNAFDDMEPVISRDGRKIVFQSDRGSGFDIFIMNVDGTNQVNLTNNGLFNIQPSISPDGGRIVFASGRDGLTNIFAMNVDGTNVVNLTGSSLSNNSDPFFSADGSKIAFRSDRDGNQEIYVMNADGTSQTRLTFTPSVFEEQPAFSPNGTKIVFNTEQDATSEIWVMNADGSNPTRLTNNASLERHATFSPDGTRIAFTSGRDGNNEIYVMQANGANPQRLTNVPGSDFGATWGLTAPAPAPGLPKIAFTTRRGGSVLHIYTMNIDGSNQTPLTSGSTDNVDPAWSPDGTKIAFSSERDGDYEIFVMNADGSNQTQLTFNTSLDYKPSWSPDGTKIAFTRKASISSSSATIVTMSADGTKQTNITPNSSGINEFPSWSPDGTKIVFTRIFTSDAQRDIYVVNSDGSNGSNPVRLTNNAPLYDNHPDWSPDGTRIAYTCSDPAQPSNWEICTMNSTDGSDVRKLTTNAATEVFPSWSYDSQQILFTTNRDGNSEIYSMRADGAYLTNLTNNAASDSQPDWQPNVAWAATTSTGSNVAVQMGLVSVTFSGVTQAGTTSQYAVDPASLGPLPSGFTFGPGLPAYEISTSATYTPPVTVCVQVPTVTDLTTFNALNLFHYENGALRNRTSSRDFSTKTICASVNSLSPFAIAQQLAPTAAPVSITGRAVTDRGRAISRAMVTVTDMKGQVRRATTNSFGYFRFEGLPAGEDYVLAASHRQYRFKPQLISATQDVTDARLIGTLRSSIDNGQEVPLHTGKSKATQRSAVDAMPRSGRRSYKFAR